MIRLLNLIPIIAMISVVIAGLRSEGAAAITKDFFKTGGLFLALFVVLEIIFYFAGMFL